MPGVRVRLGVGFSIAHIVAALSTGIRLWYRYQRQQLWWDDFWALVAAVSTLLSAGVEIASHFPPPGGYPLPAHSFISWSCFFTQAAVIWSARMSIQATVIYFLPPGRNRIISKFALVALAASWLIVSIAKLFYCGIPIPVVPSAPYSKIPTAINMAMNIVSTVWLVGWPAYLFARMGLKKPLRRLFMIAFSTALVLLAADLFHAGNLIAKTYSLAMISGPLEILASVLVANVLVFAGYIYRIVGQSNESGQEPKPTTTQFRPRLSANSLGNMTSGLSSSEIGPLTTVYSSNDNFASSRTFEHHSTR